MNFGKVKQNFCLYLLLTYLSSVWAHLPKIRIPITDKSRNKNNILNNKIKKRHFYNYFQRDRFLDVIPAWGFLNNTKLGVILLKTVLLRGVNFLVGYLKWFHQTAEKVASSAKYFNQVRNTHHADIKVS